jgi:hypothetical protein
MPLDLSQAFSETNDDPKLGIVFVDLFLGRWQGKIHSTRLLQMMRMYGCVGMAKRIMQKTHEDTETFIKLCAFVPELTVEYWVAHRQFAHLFTPEERKTARARLAKWTWSTAHAARSSQSGRPDARRARRILAKGRSGEAVRKQLPAARSRAPT